MTTVHELWGRASSSAGASSSTAASSSGEEVMIAYLEARPAYCDRGRWRQGIEVDFFRSDADPGPRYYFDLETGKSETLAYLRAKGVDVEGASWREVSYKGSDEDLFGGSNLMLATSSWGRASWK